MNIVTLLIIHLMSEFIVSRQLAFLIKQFPLSTFQ